MTESVKKTNFLLWFLLQIVISKQWLDFIYLYDISAVYVLISPTILFRLFVFGATFVFCV